MVELVRVGRSAEQLARELLQAQLPQLARQRNVLCEAVGVTPRQTLKGDAEPERAVHAHTMPHSHMMKG
ncbi:hypothetical protein [Candidatus Palauibacter sp.]|uniref:hypothetical protein n=1 Tax=Candidatus Palauibacter sp. TaxID=3101350 RepID=UPI003B01E6F9